MIEAKKVLKSFNGHLILNELSLSVNKGETLVIIGRSGCGKSVFLKHLIGIIKPDGGEISVDGVNMSGLSAKHLNELRLRFGMLFQSSALFDSMTVGENVGFSLIEHTQLSQPVIAERVNESLELVGLDGIEDLKPSELSGGMKKRVALARAICMRPEILLYDEPTTGLDPIMADAINDLIIAMNEKLKVTSIVVTHDMTSCYKIASRIAMMYQGKIVQIGTPDEIRNSKDPVVRQFISGSAAGPITDVHVKSFKQLQGESSP
ncbi:MAG: ABC transporter ATP-binding protein [Candidatus Omnitrophica bacterium CG1_02_46_14]|nr:MAG: ABC transporter ATP-binding protein [Candidatus Omnitrophica bacterium CG1_02_46_14]